MHGRIPLGVLQVSSPARAEIGQGRSAANGQSRPRRGERSAEFPPYENRAAKLEIPTVADSVALTSAPVSPVPPIFDEPAQKKREACWLPFLLQTR